MPGSDLVPILGTFLKAYSKAMTIQNIMQSFRSAGVNPFNQHAGLTQDLSLM